MEDIVPFGKKTTRGLKWNNLEIKEMLQVAVDLNVNQLFESHRMSSNEIYKKIHGKFPSKTIGQIKLKFESLRRNYSADNAERQKSGAAGIIETIYDREMALLWGNRKKFTVPQNHGLDVAMIHINPEIIIDALSDEESTNEPDTSQSGASFVAGQVPPHRPSQSTSKSTPPPKEKNKSQADIIQQFKDEQQKMLMEFKKMNEEAEERSDRRCDMFLNELRAIRETINSTGTTFSQYQQPFVIPAPTPSPSGDEASISYTYEMLCHEIAEHDEF